MGFLVADGWQCVRCPQPDWPLVLTAHARSSDSGGGAGAAAGAGHTGLSVSAQRSPTADTAVR